jgi:hypothetical protein
MSDDDGEAVYERLTTEKRRAVSKRKVKALALAATGRAK